MREVIVGRNSKVWKSAAMNPEISTRFQVVLGHREVPQFSFTSNDRVWVFSYSRLPAENSRLLATLESAGVGEVVYVSSATTIVSKVTRCYEYPRVKQLAEEEALRRLRAHILTLGIVVDSVEELPAGSSVATLQSEINEFLLCPRWPKNGSGRMELFAIIRTKFPTTWERMLHGLYGKLIWALRRWPCVLRPLDYVLRAVGIRWYGYVYLSNKLWTMTTL